MSTVDQQKLQTQQYIANSNDNNEKFKNNEYNDRQCLNQNQVEYSMNKQYKYNRKANKLYKLIWKIALILQIIIIPSIIIGIYCYHIKQNSKYLTPQKYYKQFTVQINKQQKQLIKMQSHIFRASQKLQYPLNIQNKINNQQNIQPITVIFTCSGRRYNLFQITLKSFFKHNTYPLYQIIAIDDGLDNPQFQRFIRKYPNITFISTNLRVGQLCAIDIAYSFVKTQYYFHSQQDFLYLQDSFIQKSLKIMKKYPKVSQVIISSMLLSKYQQYQGEIKQDKSLFGAHSFNPSLKRKHQYKIFVQKYGGYLKFARDKSFGQGAGNTQICISIYLQKLGYYGYKLYGHHVQHNGQGSGLNRFQYQGSQNCVFD